MKIILRYEEMVQVFTEEETKPHIHVRTVSEGGSEMDMGFRCFNNPLTF